MPENQENKEQYIIDPELGAKILADNPVVEAEIKQDTFTPSPMWEAIKETYGETFKMPEGLTKENEMELYKQTLKGFQSNKHDDLPETAKEILKLQQEGKFDEEKYFEQKLEEKKLKSLPSKEFLHHIYKKKNGYSEENQTGWTDEDITQFLDGKNKIELDMMAATEKEQMYKNQEKAKPKEEKNAPVEDTNYVKNIVETVKKGETFSGIFVDDKERDTIEQEFLKEATTDPKTQTNQLGKYLGDDNVLYTMYALYKAHLNKIERAKQIAAKEKKIDEGTSSKPPISSASNIADALTQDVKTLID